MHLHLVYLGCPLREPSHHTARKPTKPVERNGDPRCIAAAEFPAHNQEQSAGHVSELVWKLIFPFMANIPPLMLCRAEVSHYRNDRFISKLNAGYPNKE